MLDKGLLVESPPVAKELIIVLGLEWTLGN
jgi:hypothetical protein